MNFVRNFVPKLALPVAITTLPFWGHGGSTCAASLNRVVDQLEPPPIMQVIQKSSPKVGDSFQKFGSLPPKRLCGR